MVGEALTGELVEVGGKRCANALFVTLASRPVLRPFKPGLLWLWNWILRLRGGNFVFGPVHFSTHRVFDIKLFGPAWKQTVENVGLEAATLGARIDKGIR